MNTRKSASMHALHYPGGLHYRGPFLDNPNDEGDQGEAAATAIVERVVKEVTTQVSAQVKEPLESRLAAMEASNTEQAKANAEALAQYSEEIKALAEASKARAGLPGYDPNAIEDPAKKFSLARACWGHLKGWTGDTKSFPERELIHEYKDHLASAGIEKAAGGQQGIGDTGGLLVSTTMMPTVIEELLANNVAVQAGVELMDNLSGGPIMLPREEGGITAYRKGESLPITESQESFSQLELRPLELTARTRLSKLLMLQTGTRVSSILERKLGRKIGLRMDLDFFTGGGGNVPIGILNAPAPGSATWDWSTPHTLVAPSATVIQTVTDNAEEMVNALKARNAYYGFGEVMWFGHPTTFSALRRLSKSTDGVPFNAAFERMLGDGVNGVSVSDRFYGHRYAETTQLTTGSTADLLLLAVKAATMAIWDTLEIFPSEHADGAYENNELAIRAVAYNDSAIYRGDHLQRASNLDATIS